MRIFGEIGLMSFKAALLCAGLLICAGVVMAGCGADSKTETLTIEPHSKAELAITAKQQTAYAAAQRAECEGDIGTGTKEFPTPKNKNCYYYRVLNASVPRASYEFEFHGDFESSYVCRRLKEILPSIKEDFVGVAERHPKTSPKSAFEGKYNTYLKRNITVNYLDRLDSDKIVWTDMPNTKFWERQFDLTLAEHFSINTRGTYGNNIFEWNWVDNPVCRYRCKLTMPSRRDYVEQKINRPTQLELNYLKFSKLQFVELENSEFSLFNYVERHTANFENTLPTIQQGRFFRGFGWEDDLVNLYIVYPRKVGTKVLNVPISQLHLRSVVRVYSENNLLFFLQVSGGRTGNLLGTFTVRQIDPSAYGDMQDIIKSEMDARNLYPLKDPTSSRFETKLICRININLKEGYPFAFKEKTQ